MTRLFRYTASLLAAFLMCTAAVPAEEPQAAGVTTARDSIFPKRSGSPAAAGSGGSQATSAPEAQPAPESRTAPAQQQGPASSAGNTAGGTKDTAPAGSTAGGTPAVPAGIPDADTSEAADPAASASVDFFPTDQDPYSGWKYSVFEKATYRSGRLQVSVNGTQGSFGIYEIRDDGKEVPLLSSYDFFSSTAFMLRIGRKEYLLNYAGGIKSEARQTEAGLQLAYTIPGKAFFLLDFVFPAVEAGRTAESAVQVTLYTVNRGENPQTFTNKAIFDTILGESSSQHFSTYESPELNTQRKFQTMKNDRWICSANKTASLALVLSGAGISEPGSVTLGPIASLSESWEPTVNDGKGFSTVLSYNNSGVAVNWKTAYLLPGQVDTKRFAIAATHDRRLLDALESGGVPFAAKAEAVQDRQQEEAAVPIPAAEAKEDAAPVAEAAPLPAAEDPPLSPAAQAVTEAQLDFEYIQNLIDYIESLEGEDAINRDEYTSLNEELDAIFEKIRSMGN